MCDILLLFPIAYDILCCLFLLSHLQWTSVQSLMCCFHKEYPYDRPQFLFIRYVLLFVLFLTGFKFYLCSLNLSLELSLLAFLWLRFEVLNSSVDEVSSEMWGFVGVSGLWCFEGSVPTSAGSNCLILFLQHSCCQGVICTYSELPQFS